MNFQAECKSNENNNRKLHIASHYCSGPDHNYEKDNRVGSNLLSGIMFFFERHDILSFEALIGIK